MTKRDMKLEHEIWEIRRTAPKLVKEKFDMDCKFLRYTNGWCTASEKLEMLLSLLDQWDSSDNT